MANIPRIRSCMFFQSRKIVRYKYELISYITVFMYRKHLQIYNCLIIYLFIHTKQTYVPKLNCIHAFAHNLIRRAYYVNFYWCQLALLMETTWMVLNWIMEILYYFVLKRFHSTNWPDLSYLKISYYCAFSENLYIRQAQQISKCLVYLYWVAYGTILWEQLHTFLAFSFVFAHVCTKLPSHSNTENQSE